MSHVHDLKKLPFDGLEQAASTSGPTQSERNCTSLRRILTEKQLFYNKDICRPTLFKRELTGTLTAVFCFFVFILLLFLLLRVSL